MFPEPLLPDGPASIAVAGIGRGLFVAARRQPGSGKVFFDRAPAFGIIGIVRRQALNGVRVISEHHQGYIAKPGMLIESPPLYIAHVVKQANGNPQALADLLADSSKERLVDKRHIREMRHAAGVRYIDFTPIMVVALASIVAVRYMARGTGDTELYVFAGMVAAFVIALRVFLFRGAGKAN
ncbi:MAG: hypothetical protein RKO66_17905 [Candidatus Contendobacter sp.]|nr:hypothetical protein [Candidatus Contendobacter sp.]MDS4058019.1 hypothetical protein [Candidatus Contendobacter sp.]